MVQITPAKITACAPWGQPVPIQNVAAASTAAVEIKAATAASVGSR